MLADDEFDALSEALAAGLQSTLQASFDRMMELIRGGMDARTASSTVLDEFSGDFADLLAQAFTQVLGEAVGTAAVLSVEVAGVSLSQRLYANATNTADDVAGIVARHAAGFQDARQLALDLFTGYDLRQGEPEVLKLNPSEPSLPRYLREALLRDDGTRDELAAAYAKLQVKNLSSTDLRIAYQKVLDAIDRIERTGAGQDLLERQLKVAYYERMRYFATRIARTELARAQRLRRAKLYLDDDSVRWVRIERSAASPKEPCICALITERDQYGGGPGAYPIELAPMPPFHPFCMCGISPARNIRKEPELDEDADVYFLNRLNESVAARIVGSRAKLDRVLSGDATAIEIANERRDPLYHIRSIREAVDLAGGGP